jgi:hypothetical protein
MTLHDLIAEFEAEFAKLIDCFRSHPAVQAVPNSSTNVPIPDAKNVPPATPPDDAINPGRPTVTDLLYKPNAETAAILDSRVGQSSSSGPAVFDDGVIRYFHHTYASGQGQTMSTEPLKGPAKLSFSYTGDQLPEKQGPSVVWVSINGGPEVEYECGVEAQVDLPGMPVGAVVAVHFRGNTDGRTLAQVLNA